MLWGHQYQLRCHASSMSVYLPADNTILMMCCQGSLFYTGVHLAMWSHCVGQWLAWWCMCLRHRVLPHNIRIFPGKQGYMRNPKTFYVIGLQPSSVFSYTVMSRKCKLYCTWLSLDIYAVFCFFLIYIYIRRQRSEHAILNWRHQTNQLSRCVWTKIFEGNLWTLKGENQCFFCSNYPHFN